MNILNNEQLLLGFGLAMVVVGAIIMRAMPNILNKIFGSNGYSNGNGLKSLEKKFDEFRDEYRENEKNRREDIKELHTRLDSTVGKEDCARTQGTLIKLMESLKKG
jgi:hypothetical protein